VKTHHNEKGRRRLCGWKEFAKSVTHSTSWKRTDTGRARADTTANIFSKSLAEGVWKKNLGRPCRLEDQIGGQAVHSALSLPPVRKTWKPYIAEPGDEKPGWGKKGANLPFKGLGAMK